MELRCSKCTRIIYRNSAGTRRFALCQFCEAPEKTAPEPAAPRQQMRCTNCKYKFRSGKEHVTCGYCGSADVVPERQNAADRLVRASF